MVYSLHDLDSYFISLWSHISVFTCDQFKYNCIRNLVNKIDLFDQDNGYD